jgi:hypothetical protein
MLKRLLNWQPKHRTAAIAYKVTVFILIALAAAFLGDLLKKGFTPIM